MWLGSPYKLILPLALVSVLQELLHIDQNIHPSQHHFLILNHLELIQNLLLIRILVVAVYRAIVLLPVLLRDPLLHDMHHHHLTEKTNQFSNSGRYVFKVSKSANKIEVKKAIEKVYDVHVVNVNMMNVLGKKRRQGKTTGRTQDWKKAIVTLKNGERIAGLAEGV